MTTANPSSLTDLRPLRFGIIGMGKMGLLHSAILNSLPGCSITAVVEPSPLTARTIAKLMPQVKVLDSTEELLRSKEIDGAVITTPVADHVPTAIQCAQGGIPFLLEKPLALTAVQSQDLLRVLKAHPVTQMVGFMTRFVDSFEMAKTIIAGGYLGRLQRVVATIYVSQLFQKGSGWRYDRRQAGGGVLLSQGSHLLDLLTWCFGPVDAVNANVQSVYSEEIDDFAHVMLHFRSGLRGWMDCSWSVRFKRVIQTTIDVLGEKGSLVVTDDNLHLYLEEPGGSWAAGHTRLKATDLYRGVLFDVGGPQYTREDEAFVNALRTNSPAQPDVDQGYHVQSIVDAAYRSSQNKGSQEQITP